MRIDAKGIICDADPNVLSNLLLPQREIIGTSFFDFIQEDPNAPPLNIRYLGQISSQKKTISSHLKDGGPFFWTCRQIHASSSLSAPDLDDDDSSFLIISYLAPHTQHSLTVHRNSTIGAIIAGFAHEVRNPLAAIVSLTESVITPDLPIHMSIPLSRIIPLVERIENLIKVALSYGRPRPPRQQWYQTAHIVQRVLEHLRDSGTDTTRIQLGATGTSAPIHVDRDHFISILTNLLLNALQSSQDAAVSITFHRPTSVASSILEFCHPPVLAIDVTDTGPGIPTSTQEKIFEPFFTTKREGTGLGLALANELARINAGELILFKTSPQGTTFRLFLPTTPQ